MAGAACVRHASLVPMKLQNRGGHGNLRPRLTVQSPDETAGYLIEVIIGSAGHRWEQRQCRLRTSLGCSRPALDAPLGCVRRRCGHRPETAVPVWSARSCSPTVNPCGTGSWVVEGLCCNRVAGVAQRSFGLPALAGQPRPPPQTAGPDGRREFLWPDDRAHPAPTGR